MLTGLEMAACHELAVPKEIMRHVVNVESSRNPYAIGVVGGELERQPKTFDEAVATARMLEKQGYNYSLGVAQVNRGNLSAYGLDRYDKAFDFCANVLAGSKILAKCHSRAGGDWGKAFSCYYSGNFSTGFRHGYVQRVYASMANDASATARLTRITAAPARSAPVTPEHSAAPAPAAPTTVVPQPDTRAHVAQVREPATPQAFPQPLADPVTPQADAADLRHPAADAAFVF